MTHRKRVLERTDIPQTPKAQRDRLEALCESFQHVRDEARQAGHSARELKRLEADYTGILDLFHNLECEGAAGQMLESDPLTRIDLVGRYGLLPREAANDLQQTFNAQVRAIIGHDLKPSQVRKLYALLTGFNPFHHS